MKGFTWRRESPFVVEYEAEAFGYPHRTNDGETQYDNRHFRTESEAWESLLAELRAGLSLTTSGRAAARAAYEAATTRLADMGEMLAKVRDQFEARVRDRMEVAKP